MNVIAPLSAIGNDVHEGGSAGRVGDGVDTLNSAAGCQVTVASLSKANSSYTIWNLTRPCDAKTVIDGAALRGAVIA